MSRQWNLSPISNISALLSHQVDKPQRTSSGTLMRPERHFYNCVTLSGDGTRSVSNPNSGFSVQQSNQSYCMVVKPNHWQLRALENEVFDPCFRSILRNVGAKESLKKRFEVQINRPTTRRQLCRFEWFGRVPCKPDQALTRIALASPPRAGWRRRRAADLRAWVETVFEDINKPALLMMYGIHQ